MPGEQGPPLRAFACGERRGTGEFGCCNGVGSLDELACVASDHAVGST